MEYSIRYFIDVVPEHIYPTFARLHHERYCNGFCQKFVPNKTFAKKKDRICQECHKKNHYARKLISTGKYSPEEIKNNIKILDDYDKVPITERKCKNCNEWKTLDHYSGRCTACHECENKIVRERVYLFRREVHEYFSNIRVFDNQKIYDYLVKQPKEYLIILSSYIKAGRHASDTKETVIKKIMEKLPYMELFKIKYDFAEEHDGHIDVHTEYGLIDVMCKDKIVVVDYLKNWKNSIRKIIMFSLLFDKDIERIIIIPSEYNESVDKIIKSYDIKPIFI